MDRNTKYNIMSLIQIRGKILRELIKRSPLKCKLRYEDFENERLREYFYICGYLNGLLETGAINYYECNTWERVAARYIVMIQKREMSARFDH